ncbi:MAG: N-acetylglucosaminyltransferase [Bradyrhizobium sp.]|uniref:N-acetylglucosaminyltransferase n=1 Tax=Bradyrhizobium sp. TaxID=376 RepID=UPI0012205154|nr:N-acetylglucosaminyltransferase [Bradyrhizobium sp.]THD68394.1 MAG: N-acetylglucosaminyltransferase [Bradyrhizobium sp.]
MPVTRIASRRTTRMAVYDCFPFFKELDILEIRLRELHDLVDKFVLVESHKTFSGRNKPLFFGEHRERFAPFLDKIIHVVADPPDGTAIWQREIFQRDAIERGLIDADPADLVIVSDVDEIPKPEELRKIVAMPRGRTIHCLGCDQYRMRLNLRMLPDSDIHHLGPVIVTRRYFRSAQHLRAFWPRTGYRKIPTAIAKAWDALRARKKLNFYGIPNVVRGGAWHFSFIGDDDAIRDKLASYSHQESNVPEMLKTIPDAIRIALEQGRFIRQTGSFRVEKLDAMPMTVQRDAKRFDHLILPRPN